MPDKCVYCGSLVKPRQHALQCDTCNNWNHRKCDSGISIALYRKLVKGEEEISWWCHICKVPEGVEGDSDPEYNEGDQTGDDTGDIRGEDIGGDGDGNGETGDGDCIGDDIGDDIGIDDGDGIGDSDGIGVVEDDDVNINHASFNISNREFAQPNVPLESSIEEENISDVEVEDEPGPLVFAVHEDGTKRNKRKLSDNRGYTYNVKRTRNEKIDWQCTVRSKTVRCPATVVQKNDTFTPGPSEHSCCIC